MKTTVSPDGTVTVETDPVAKATWDGETARIDVLKAVASQRFTLSVGYPAELADFQKARDGHRDFANRDEVEKAAWGYMRNGAKVGLLHGDGTEGAGEVVESYIYRADADWVIGDQIVKSGDWLVGIVWDEPTWAEIEAGRLNGTSLQGSGARRAPSPSDMPKVKTQRG
jgi:Putative phage serine protease XkdF